MLGFGFNKTKVLAAAERHIQQGRLGNAIAEYQKILKHDARDVTVLNTVGDLYARLTKAGEATECFREVAETYAGSGFTVKAIAVYKKLSKLNPGDLEYVLKLGELYRQQGLHNDARAQYMQAADSLMRSGNMDEGTQLYEKILELDPENLSLQTKLAELYLRLSRNAQAGDLLLRLAENSLRRGLLDGAQKALTRLDTLLANDPRVLELKGRLALQRGNPAQAAEFLEKLPALRSSESGLQLLSNAYLQSGAVEKALPVARKLLVEFSQPEFLSSCCDRLLSAHRIPEALQLFAEFSDQLLNAGAVEKLQGCIANLREDPDALEQLKKLLEKAGDVTHSGEILELVAHASVQQGNLERARVLYQQLMQLEPQDENHQRNYQQVLSWMEAPGSSSDEILPPSATPTTPAQTYPEELEEEIRTALAESELFENYSKLPKKEFEPLLAVLASAPFDVRLNQRLASLYAREQQFAEAAQCCEKLNQVFSVAGKKEQARDYAEMAARYRAEADAEITQNETTEVSPEPTESFEPEFSKPEPSNTSDSEPGTDSEPASPPNPSGPAELAFADAPVEIDLSDEWGQVSVEDVSPAARLDAGQAGEIVEEIRFYLTESLLPEAEFAIQHLSEVDSQNPELAVLRRQLATKLDAREAETTTPAVPVEEIEIEPPASAAGVSSGADSSTPAPGASVPSSLGEFVSDLESSLGTDFDLDVPTSSPDFTFNVPTSSSKTPAPVASQMTADAAGSFSPAAQTGPPAILGADSLSQAPVDDVNSLLSDVFQEFKDEMEAGSVEEADAETHYNLGLAFQEMGLIEEAIGEFQKVCQAIDQGQPFSQAIQAYTWLAHCLVSKGVPEASFKWYQRALQAASNDQSKTAIYYELGQAHEAAGQKPEALKCFLEVYASNIDHRDVAERIRALKS